MKLYKLIGYNNITDIYTNPSTGEVENLPSVGILVSESPIANYEEFDTIESWAKYGQDLLGTITGLKDYLSLRYQIYTRIEAICGEDYSNYNLLNEEQKQAAIKWSNIRIANAQGIVFYISKCGSQQVADAYIAEYLTKAEIARQKRYDTAFTVYGFTYLGKQQALKAENYARHSFVDAIYIKRGVVFKDDDGVEGLGDWVLGNYSFAGIGLKQRIETGEFNLLYGMTVGVFCDNLINVINNGMY